MSQNCQHYVKLKKYLESFKFSWHSYFKSLAIKMQYFLGLEIQILEFTYLHCQKVVFIHLNLFLYLILSDKTLRNWTITFITFRPTLCFTKSILKETYQHFLFVLSSHEMETSCMQFLFYYFKIIIIIENAYLREKELQRSSSC